MPLITGSLAGNKTIRSWSAFIRVLSPDLFTEIALVAKNAIEVAFRPRAPALCLDVRRVESVDDLRMRDRVCVPLEDLPNDRRLILIDLQALAHDDRAVGIASTGVVKHRDRAIPVGFSTRVESSFLLTHEPPLDLVSQFADVELVHHAMDRDKRLGLVRCGVHTLRDEDDAHAAERQLLDGDFRNVCSAPRHKNPRAGVGFEARFICRVQHVALPPASHLLKAYARLVRPVSQ